MNLHNAQSTHHIAMRDAAIVEKLQGGGDVARDHGRLLLGEVDATLNVVEQRAAAHLLEDHVEAVVLLENLEKIISHFPFLLVPQSTR